MLEIKLYRLARMEIDAILKELAEKEKRAAQIRALLADEPGRWKVVRKELRDVKKAYADESPDPDLRARRGRGVRSPRTTSSRRTST